MDMCNYCNKYHPDWQVCEEYIQVIKDKGTVKE